ncbi:hypothetical protein FEM48_Zijuj09G0161200 [Ziziphus jujuba var. spinosa]|uniref:Uncharacterized protein n=1 Tax=Ziziphus jujuba var. spinosa TaxID=714518 RepID=A0A978UTZ1_ZIZJJ|nr:hypothetical protein FEM48_Zijuj09G0161200 [Ziziphus jujuba var. spinosa]
MAVMKCAIELGIAEIIENHGNPITLSELSSMLGCSPSQLHRIMRFLVHRRIFKETNTSQSTSPSYSQTPLSRLLMKTGEYSMAAFVLMESIPPMLAPWHCLSARVLGNGSSAFEAANGEDLWSYTIANPAHGQLFNEAMACGARVTVPAIVDKARVKAFPWIRGINFDLPHVVCAAKKTEGVENVGGDMFDCVPKADAVFVMWVLHDWEDDECIQILKKCREAIPKEKGKVIMVEAVILEKDDEKEEDDLSDVKLMLDMVIMAHTNTGKERTLKDWVYVLGQAGFSRHTIRPIDAIQSVIEAFP